MYTQKNFTQLKQAASSFLLSAPLKQFYTRAFKTGSILAFFVYTSVRLMLHDFPFEILEEILFILRILFACCFLGGLCIGGFSLLMFAADNNAAIRRISIQRITRFYSFFTKAIKAITIEKIMTRKRPVIESINIHRFSILPDSVNQQPDIHLQG